MDFKPFPKIEHFVRAPMQITQKIHGSNAQVCIVPVEPGECVQDEECVEIDGVKLLVRAGSRTRWIWPLADNYGFAAYVRSHKEAFARLLGPGQHFGEWAGKGINSGEGLADKKFVLFDFWMYPPERPLPPDCVVVPVLHQGPFDSVKIQEVMAELKSNGSKLCPGFMRPEGIVVTVLGHRLKMVFEDESTSWKKSDKAPRPSDDEVLKIVEPLLQPIRLEKLLSRDERYLIGYPKTLPMICSAYVQDLVDEGEIKGDADVVAATKKAMGKYVFGFVKSQVKLSAC